MSLVVDFKTYNDYLPVSHKPGCGLKLVHQILQGGYEHAFLGRMYRLAGSLKLYTHGLFGTRCTAAMHNVLHGVI